MSSNPPETSDTPAFRYDGKLADSIELRWQERWKEEGIFNAPNPVGELSKGFDNRPKMFIMDMFPYPSGVGLHVGHPLGFIGTDIYARFLRMAGYNVLHTMGYDAFGLPAEQYAVQKGTHPRVTTEANIANMRRQLNRLGLGHDPRRSVSTTDVEYYRWTQWIFRQIFESWFDESQNKARPISELVNELDSGKRQLKDGRDWSSLDEVEKRRVLLDDYRLAYISEAPVNWCPGLGTVLANEEVTNEGRSERGNFPVYRRNMRQWMMRITKYSDRLIDDLGNLDWPESVKLMQRNWIGRSTGAHVDFPVIGSSDSIRVFTTRPDTLFGATYMVLAPEHPMVEKITAKAWPEHTHAAWKGPLDSSTPEAAVADYKAISANKSDLERQVDVKHKTGVFTGSFAVNPVNGDHIPIFIADYVLMHYGTGAIMAVPAHDERDFEFAKQFGLPLVAVIEPTEDWYKQFNLQPFTPADAWPEPFSENHGGHLIASHNSEISLDGLGSEEAKVRISEWLAQKGFGEPTTTYKLRDWLFSRQRYWGEPFPIVWDEHDTPIALPEEMLPVELPELNDWTPKTSDDDESIPEPPLGRAEDWKTVTLDLGEEPKQYRRELNTMPQWAGSCWYYLRYIDPTNNAEMVDPENEHYWMNGKRADGSPAVGGVDLYVGGVEHAVLHLLYSRFWHKVLYDLGHVSTIEPFQRLINQGMIQADAFTDHRGIYVEASEVEKRGDAYFYNGEPVNRETGKMGKSLKNAVNPDDIYAEYGADSMRLYEMSMGPIDTDRPWSSTGIVGLYRFLQRFWRNMVDENTGELRISETPIDAETQRLVHKTIAAVRDDLMNLRFNTAISKLIELNNHVTKLGSIDRPTAEAFVLMLAPLAPHITEELWAKLGHAESLTWHPFPVADESLLADDVLEIPVQVGGKVRARLTVPAGTSTKDLEAAALADENVQKHLEGKTIRKVIAVPDRMVNIVV